MKVIILAGGLGKRLWPISNHNCPKQFLNLFDHKSLLQKTVERFDEANFVDHVLISTNVKYRELLEKNRPKSKKQLSILYEPISKNTAPAIALSVKYLEKHLKISPNEPILVLPSDQLIEPVGSFFAALEQISKTLNCITTFGIKPTRPDTGYGYIKIKNTTDEISPIVQFIEKPHIDIAKKIYNEPGYFWNSGMFLFNGKILWEAISKCNACLFQTFSKSYEFSLKNFSSVSNISFDHAIMEKINNGCCKTLDVSWSDIGSWESLYDVLSKDSNRNVKVGNIVDLDTKNSLIVGQKKLISTIGLENIICIETDDAIFLAKKGKSHDLKRLLDLIHLNDQKTR